MRKSLAVFIIVWRITIVGAHSLEPEGVLSELAAVASEISDYQVRVVSWATLDGKDERRVTDLAYRAPDDFRIDVLQGSNFGDRGSVGLLTDDGQVIARTGLRFFPATLSYDKHHRRVTSLRGRAIDGPHIHTIVESMRENLTRGIINVSSADETILIEATYESGSKTVVERINLDEASLLPVQFETLEQGRLVEYVRWFHYLIDVGLPDEVFNVRNDREDIAELPVKTLARVPLGDEELSVLARFE